MNGEQGFMNLWHLSPYVPKNFVKFSEIIITQCNAGDVIKADPLWRKKIWASQELSGNLFAVFGTSFPVVGLGCLCESRYME